MRTSTQTPILYGRTVAGGTSGKRHFCSVSINVRQMVEHVGWGGDVAVAYRDLNTRGFGVYRTSPIDEVYYWSDRPHIVRRQFEAL